MTNLIVDVLEHERSEVLKEWLEEVRVAIGSGKEAKTLLVDAERVLQGLKQGLRSAEDDTSLTGAAWKPLIEVLEDVSASGAAQGITAAQTSAFVLALKKPLFQRLQARMADDATKMSAAIWTLSVLVDRLAQRTLTSYQASREAVIQRQQEELLELSTPVIKLWDGVLAVPMIGTLDSNRTQLVMETLLQSIVATNSELAIIDITGVPTVDTMVAQHLLKTVTAIRLMGAECIISGIRPQIAQTIVHLGIDLQGVTTRASLADALSLAFKRGGYTVTKNKA